MVKETELYDILKVSPTATQSEIKKSFRKLALANHPDKGGDENEFKKINNAYSILSNEAKRKQYDLRGKAGLESEGINEEMFNDIIGNIFGQSFMFGNMFGNRGNNRGPAKTKPTIYQLHVSLEELCIKKEKKIAIHRNRTCECVQSTNDTCKACDGKGFIESNSMRGPVIMRQQRICDVCKGQKQIYKGCSKCKNGLIGDKGIVRCKLSPEMPQGYKFVFSGEGDQECGKEVGDLVVVVLEKEHSLFQRQGGHLITELELTLKDALCGFKRTLKHPDGTNLDIDDNGEVITPNMQRMFSGLGMSSKYDLYVVFKVSFPTTLTQRQRQLLEDILEDILEDN